ncbi:ShlB/FhaC/HecB family hemolysin secretion/activation protein [Sphingomonas sp. 1P06PA]|uniref:ShlB/FhaC/HecB family hemolysin secretion/activation protein n=1 Tax=Sphingomonas sp. 1P06PA TaxID=554121 RepID=UPI0039A755E9
MLSRFPVVPVSTGMLLTGVLAGLPSVANAQAVQPPVQQPGIDAPTRDQIEQPRPDAATAPAPRARVEASRAVEAAPCPFDRYDLQTVISTIRFSGPGDAALPPEIAPLLSDIAAAPPAGTQPLKIVCDIRDRATSALRRAGYVASVQIPPQRLEGGELKLEVVTARIVEVRVRGDAGPYGATIEARIAQLKALTPLNERDAERVLLLAGDIPGLDVQLGLRPAGTAPGEVIGDLTVAYRPFSILGNVQNYGSRQLGRETAYLRGEYYGLTGASDVTYLGGSATLDFDEQKVVQGGHIMGLGASGATIGLSGTYAWSRPDIGQLDLRSESLIAGLEVRAPLAVSVDRRLFLAGGMEMIEQRTRVHRVANGQNVSDALNRDKLRVAYIRLDGTYRDRNAAGIETFSLAGSLELRQGLDILNATKMNERNASGYTPSRPDGDPTATVIRGKLESRIGVGPIFSLYGQARGQWSNNPLLNFEEYAIGNLTIGRGYDPGANSADRAIGLRGELIAKVIDLPARVELFGFYDSVWLWNKDRNAIETDRRLGSYGGGVRAFVPGLALVEAMYARPTNKALLLPNARRAPDRFLMSITLQFAPGAR